MQGDAVHVRTLAGKLVFSQKKCQLHILDLLAELLGLKPLSGHKCFQSISKIVGFLRVFNLSLDFRFTQAHFSVIIILFEIVVSRYR